MANVKALKRDKVGDPDPPAHGNPSGNLGQVPRSQEPTAALQLKIPQSVYESFGEQAGKEFGYKKGGKVGLFLKMWEHYQKSLGI